MNESSINTEQIEEIKTESNFGIIKCYKLVFSFKGKLKNIGFWIFLFLVLAHIPLLILYFTKGTNSITKYVFNEMEKNGYITGNDNNKTLKKRKSINFSRTGTLKKRNSKYFKRKSTIHSPIKRRKSIKAKENNNEENINKEKRKSIKAKDINNNQENKNY